MLNIILNLLLLSFLVNFITYRLIIRRVHPLQARMEKVGKGRCKFRFPRTMHRMKLEDWREASRPWWSKIANSTARLRETLVEKEKLLFAGEGFQPGTGAKDQGSHPTLWRQLTTS